MDAYKDNSLISNQIAITNTLMPQQQQLPTVVAAIGLAETAREETTANVERGEGTARIPRNLLAIALIYGDESPRTERRRAIIDCLVELDERKIVSPLINRITAQ